MKPYNKLGSYKKKFANLCIVLFSSLVALNAEAATPLINNFTANYHVKYHGILAGTLTQKLTRENNQTYAFYQRYYSRMVLIRIHTLEISKGVWHDSIIQPGYYAKMKQPEKNQKQTEIIFNRRTEKAHYLMKQQIGDIAIQPDTQDPLSCQLLLRQTLLQKPIKQFTCPYFNGKKLQSYHFNVLQNEKLETAFGTLDTLKIEQRNPDPKKQKYMSVFWLSPLLNYLPVRVDYVVNGRVQSEALIASLEGQPHPVHR